MECDPGWMEPAPTAVSKRVHTRDNTARHEVTLQLREGVGIRWFVRRRGCLEAFGPAIACRADPGPTPSTVNGTSR